MLFAVGLVILVLGTAATLASPFLGLLIYWAWGVVRPQEVWTGLGSGLPMERILALTLLASLVFRGKLRPLRDLDCGRVALAIGAFLAVNYMSVLTSLEPGSSFWAATDFAKTAVFFLCIITLIDDEVGLRKSLWVYALAIGWTAASSIWNFEMHPYFRQGIQRATGMDLTGGDPNSVAATLALGLPVVLVLFGTARKSGRALLLAVLAAAVICIVLTGSRNGFIMLLLVLLLTAAQSRRGKLLVPAALALLVVIWLAIPADYQERYKSILVFVEDPLHKGNSSAELSAQGRIAGFEVAWQMFTDHPILGVGAGNCPWAWASPTTTYNYHGLKGWHQPHNLPGKVLSELGLLGFLSFGGYVLAVWRELHAAKLLLRADADASPLLSGLAAALSTQLIALLVGGLSGHNLYRVDWYVAGALAVVLFRLATRHVPTPIEGAEGMELEDASYVS